MKTKFLHFGYKALLARQAMKSEIGLSFSCFQF
jgi:hypothetical protein